MMVQEKNNTQRSKNQDRGHQWLGNVGKCLAEEKHGAVVTELKGRGNCRRRRAYICPEELPQGPGPLRVGGRIVVKRGMDWKSVYWRVAHLFPLPSLALWLGGAQCLQLFAPCQGLKGFCSGEEEWKCVYGAPLLSSPRCGHPPPIAMTHHLTPLTMSQDILCSQQFEEKKKSWNRVPLGIVGLLVISEPITAATRNECSGNQAWVIWGESGMTSQEK